MRKLLIALSLTVTLIGPAMAEGRPSGCPHAWCGCWLARHLLGHDVRNLWKATAWLRFPRTHARPGAVAVMPHHVGVVTAIDAHGNPVILSGNHNHRVGTGVYPRRRILAFVQP